MSSRHMIYILVLLVGLSGCANREEQERVKWRVSLDATDKRPYGTYIAAQMLKYFFPDAVLEPLSAGFRYDHLDNKLKRDDGPSLIIFCGLDFRLSEEEWRNLKHFASDGNELVIFCSTLDEKIEKDLSCYKEPGPEAWDFAYYPPDLDNVDVLTLSDTTASRKKYGYHGRWLKGYFSVEIDSSNITSEKDSDDYYYNTDRIYLPDTLGYAKQKPDMLRYRIGDGHITVHAAPLVLSNYFLLQPGNREYVEAIWQTLPKNIHKIYTHNYYKRTAEKAGLSILWKFPATKWALLLGIFTLLIYVLFEGKRKQRVIPIIPPLKNDSVSFVETIGRLYYNKGDHGNLAEKMIQQFLEWVRSHYFLNTNQLDALFIQQLAVKSGQPEVNVMELVEMIHETRLRSVTIDDPYLYKLYNTIQQFYKNHGK